MDDDDARGWITDEELTALALSADPHPQFDHHRAPWGVRGDESGLLPGWYMPSPTRSRRSVATTVTVGVLIVSFVLINALGLCVTYGWVTLA